MKAKQFGKLMKATRKDAKLSQRQMCKYLGITQCNLSKLERGQYIPSAPTFIRTFQIARRSRGQAKWQFLAMLKGGKRK